MPAYARSVFLNVPFDARYRKLLNALIFGVQDCGLVARCALETDDGGEVRIDKLYRIIEKCRLGIHDLSRTTLDRKNRLPRFNMPFELGLFLGAKRYGEGSQKRKSCLILDRERYRVQAFCSDIAGQDIRAHNNDVADALAAVRTWLQAALPGSPSLPGSSGLFNRYLDFVQQLPFMCRTNKLTSHALTFLDFRELVDAWILENPR